MKLLIENMTCGGCARSISATLTELSAESEVEVDLENKVVTVTTRATVEEVLAALAEDGFPAQLQ